MPIYEYQCQDCGERFEKLIRSTSQNKSIVCPQCASSHIEKTISLFGVKASGTSGTQAATCAPTST